MSEATLTMDVIIDGNPETLVAKIDVDTEDSQVIKFEFVSSSNGGPILRPATPRI
jgi:hypothetical protein